MCLALGRGSTGLLKVDAAVIDADPLLGHKVIPHQGPFGPAYDHLANLGWAEPVDVDMRHRIVGQGEGQMTHTCFARSQWIGTVRGNRLRRQTAWQDEVND